MNTLLIVFGLFLLVSAGGLLAATLQTRSRALIAGGTVAGVAGLIVIILGFSLVSVAPNERLVVFNRLTGELSEPRQPGISVVNPLTTEWQKYDVSRQTYTMSSQIAEGALEGDDAIAARTSGGQEVFLDLTVIYRINPERVNDIHRNWPNERYRTELIRPLMRSVVRDAVSLFDVESVYQERATIDNQITEAVIPALETEGFTVEDVLVRNITFTPEYATAIEAAQIAEVEIREQQFRVAAVAQEAEQVEARARGEAEARRIQAAAEADALRLIAAVLEENPSLIEYEYVQNLSDQVQVLGLPATSPFIFDLENLMNTRTEAPNASAATSPPPSDSTQDDD
ncbi:MAG: prohibitin family protein [Anaerolineales bacterium]